MKVIFDRKAWVFWTLILSAFHCVSFSQNITNSAYQTSYDELTLKATLVAGSCELNSNIPNDTINFGELAPFQIKNMPEQINNNLLSYIRTNSALGDLAPVYSQRDYAITFDIICPSYFKNFYKSFLNPQQNLLQIQFGDPSDLILGTIGIADLGYTFKLQTPGINNSLGVIIYQQNDARTSQNGLLIPGTPIALNNSDFFDYSPNFVKTSFRLTPGLFWIAPLENVTTTDFRMAISITLTLN